MSTVALHPQLLMPLHRLTPVEPTVPTVPTVPTDPVEPKELAEELVEPYPSLPRLVHLDAPKDEGLKAWTTRVREADEAVLVLDARGRIAGMSTSCAGLLRVDPGQVFGVLLVDMVTLVDFTAAALPLTEPERQVPPLRALSTGALARGLVRFTRNGRTSTHDVVGVPLARGAGALAFFTAV